MSENQKLDNTGLNYAVALSYKAIDEAKLNVEEKRRLLYSMHCFLSLFEKVKVDGVLIKYNCDDQIEKYPLYEMIYKTLTLSTASDELKAMWFLMFPYVVMIGTPHDDVLYYKIKDITHSPKIFAKVIETSFSTTTADSLEELRAHDLPNIIIDFMLPYIEWKNEKPDGETSREVERFRRWLARGKFSEVFEGSEKLLDTFPDDDNLLLVNIASRISLEPAVSEADRLALLESTVEVLDTVIYRPSSKKIFFLYYYGVAQIGLKNIDIALDKFNECLDLDPKFEPALVMIKAIEKSRG